MKGRILVIEDNAASLDLMKYLLTALGYEVGCANNGLLGLEAAKSTRYDLVLTDILMPELNGYELARRFKADESLRGVPLVAVTALAMTGDRERILSAGFDGYISKPIDPRRLAAEIQPYITEQNDGESTDR